MNTELHKRLEEAARKSFTERYPDGIDLYKDAQIDGFIAGAEHGYKEAVAQAKEWLMNKQKYYHEIAMDYGELTTWERDMARSKEIAMDDLLADFEADMNKLWEE